MQTQSPTDTRTRTSVADEAEMYASSFPGLDVEVVRTGQGDGPNVTRRTEFEDVSLATGSIGFPMLGKANIGENTVLINLITSAPPGSRWCGIDLEPGTMMLYGPGARHTGVSPVGLSFSFVAINVQAIEETADRLELKLTLPEEGRVRTLNPVDEVRSLTRFLDLASDPPDSADIAEMHHLDALHAAVAALSIEQPVREVGAGAKIDSRYIVHVCIEYADAIERAPKISEMCLIAHVSERRLRDAFTDVFDVPPIRYFRFRSLARARRILTHTGLPGRTVGGIALDLGFRNFGRFARQYEATYGVLPSETLRNGR
jgi:AraC-like DNA-binding protein